MKITLINPPFVFSSKDHVVISHCIGLRILSSTLKANSSNEVIFIDSLMEGYSNVQPFRSGYKIGLDTDKIIEKIPIDSDLIGISVPFSQLAPIAHDIVDHIKAYVPKSTVVMGGIYPSTQPQLSLTSKTDYIVIGEGEVALSQLADGKDAKNIIGVYCRESLVDNTYRKALEIEDLDQLPFPDYSIPSMERYFTRSQRARIGRVAALVTSRGCPYSCEFCSIHPVFGHNYRYRSPENVLQEIEFLVKKYGIRFLEIEDDNFTLRKDRVVKILEGIIYLNEKGAKLAWATPNGIRIDTLDEDVIKLIKRANGQNITVAIEHGDQEMLKIMNKHLDLDKAWEVLKLLVKYEIPNISVFFMIGYPGETIERFNNAYKYLINVRNLGGNINIFINNTQPYPNTKLFKRCVEAGYIGPDSDNYLKRDDILDTRDTISIVTADFDAKEVLRRKASLEQIFYKAPPLWKKVSKQLIPTKIWLILRGLKKRIKSAITLLGT